MKNNNTISLVTNQNSTLEILNELDSIQWAYTALELITSDSDSESQQVSHILRQLNRNLETQLERLYQSCKVRLSHVLHWEKSTIISNR